MHHTLAKAFSTGTWFSTLIFWITEYFDGDVVFKSMMAMLSFTLLVLQIGNQISIWKERKNKK